jgi:peptidoglycan/LPS O-acetylase OafA/YrhL
MGLPQLFMRIFNNKISNYAFSSATSAPNSFDFLRLFFAFSVFCCHFETLTLFRLNWPVSSPIAVGGFFIISGFLITKSYYRSQNLRDYISKRVRRIVPAYYLVVMGAAILFSFVSLLSFSDYFTSSSFYKYLVANLAFLNFLQPQLPSVFQSNHLPFVNASLWTIKVELLLYAFVPLMALFIKKWKPLFVFITLYLLSYVFILCLIYLYDKTGANIYSILNTQFVGQMRCFLAGTILLFYFDWFKAQLKYLLPIALLVIVLRYLLASAVLDFFFPLSFGILILFFAFYFKKFSIVSKYGDVSYGFYLFHFPVIQFFVSRGWLANNPIMLFIVCFLSVLLLSFISWHLLEKRILRRNPTNK